MKGQTRMRWDRGVDEIWKEVGGNEAEILFTGERGGCKTWIRDMMEIPLWRNVDGKSLKIYGALKEGIRMEIYLHDPTDSAEN